MSFNPRPALRPGEAFLIDLFEKAVREFQSAPGLEAGRSVDAMVDHYLVE